jgi:hypothetical protein
MAKCIGKLKYSIQFNKTTKKGEKIDVAIIEAF